VVRRWKDRALQGREQKGMLAMLSRRGLAEGPSFEKRLSLGTSWEVGPRVDGALRLPYSPMATV
jgi:hypothetical protein